MKVDRCPVTLGRRWHGFGPYSTTVAVNDLLHRRESYTGAGKLVGAVQPLKHAEHFFGEAHIEACAVVAHEKFGRFTRCIASELNAGVTAPRAELRRVTQQIL